MSNHFTPFSRYTTLECCYNRWVFCFDVFVWISFFSFLFFFLWNFCQKESSCFLSELSNFLVFGSLLFLLPLVFSTTTKPLFLNDYSFSLFWQFFSFSFLFSHSLILIICGNDFFFNTNSYLQF